MTYRTPTLPRRAAVWLLGLALALAGGQALAQQDPPGRVARLNLQQGTVSFSPAGDDSWYEAVPNRPMTTGDRLWTDRGARAEVHVGAATVRLDDQTDLAFTVLDDETTRITTQQGSLQVRVRDDLAGQRFEIGTPNLAVVVEAPGDFRIDTDPAAGITHVAVAAGRVTLFGANGESTALGANQQLTLTGRDLATVSGTPLVADAAFDRWVAERDRLEDQSISARHVSREVVGYQQLDGHGDWQVETEYGSVWYPRNVDAGWAPYRDGQWVDIAPWGWTWVDAAPWGFAPFHYGRWARIGPRWGWVPGRHVRRPVYAPALVGFVGGAVPIGGGRHGVGWFPLAPGETWRPSYRASQRYIDEANRAAHARHAAAVRSNYLNRNTQGAITVVPVDSFGRGPIGRRDHIRLPDDRMARAPVATAVPVPVPQRGERAFVGRPAANAPPGAMWGRQQQEVQQRAAQQAQAQAQQQQAQQQLQQQQAQQQQQAVRQQQEAQQRAAQAQDRQQAQQQQQAARQQQEAQQRAAQMQAQQQQSVRQQQEAQQRAAQTQAHQQAQQQQEAMREQREGQQRAAQMQAQQQQQAMRQQQEAQQRAAQTQAHQQAQQQQQAARQQQEAQQRAGQMQAQQQQQAMRQQQEAQQRAVQMQAQQQAQQQQQAARQQQEAQQRAAHQQAQQQQQAMRQQQEAQQRAAQTQAHQQAQQQQQAARQQQEAQQRAAQAQQQQQQQQRQAQQGGGRPQRGGGQGNGPGGQDRP